MAVAEPDGEVRSVGVIPNRLARPRLAAKRDQLRHRHRLHKFLQGRRMATNSTSSEGWCVTLVAGLVVADKGKPQLPLIALIPTLLFLALDGYYLALEKAFCRSYNHFIEKLHDGMRLQRISTWLSRKVDSLV